MYTKLKEVLDRAVAQAESGKGKQRHARGETPFDRQPICEIGRMVGIGYNLGQAMKKAQEASRLPEPERMVAELLGAINYLASAVMLIEESAPAKVEVNLRDQKETITRKEAEDIGLIPDSMKIIKRKPETLLSKMLREQEECRNETYEEVQEAFGLGDTCPTCHEKGGHHHSQCARNPNRDSQGRATLGGRRD